MIRPLFTSLLAASLTLGLLSATVAQDQEPETNPAVPLEKTEQEHMFEIDRLLDEGDIEGGLLAWRGAISGHPDSLILLRWGGRISTLLQQREQWELAVAVTDEMVARFTAQTAENEKALDGLLWALNFYKPLATKLEQPEQVLTRIDNALQALANSPIATHKLGISKAHWLVTLNRSDEAIALIDQQLVTNQALLSANPDDVSARLMMVEAFSSKGTIEGASRANAEAAIRAFQQAAALLDTPWVLAHRDHDQLFESWSSLKLRLLAALSESAPQEAAKEFNKFKQEMTEFLDGLTPLPANATLVQRSINDFERRLSVALKHQTLIGQPSMPILPAAWVNGGPIDPQNLKGKVVLLDFWAVWCGPCIATFPSLRKWNETYAEQGLVTIGITSYYKYDWDEATERPIKKDQLSPADEHAALEKFAAHHELKHVFAVTDGNELHQFFGVAGIPQVVLLDREGRVRMIRVGNSPNHERELTEMIEQLLQE